MPLGASRLNFLAKTQEVAAVEQRTAETITARGNAQIDTAQYKFGVSSLLVDGTGDDIETSYYHTGSETAYTIEMWIRASSFPHTFNYLYGSYVALADGRTTLAVKSDGSIFAFVGGTGGGNATSSTGLVSTGTWYHLAFVWDGSNVNVYLDGTSVLNFACSIPSQTTNPVRIGARGDDTPTDEWDGHIDEIRLSDNARYTSGFTAPTAPFVNDANTLLLIHADGTDGDTVFIDDNGDRAPVGIQALADAQISTAQSQFGSSSLYFDGTGDMIDTTTDMSFGSDDFTVECWVYPTNISNTDGIMGQWSAEEGYNWFLTFSGSGTNNGLRFGYNGGNFSTSSSTGINYNTWTHVAVVRDGTTLRYFINGTAAGTASIGATSINTGCGFKMPGAEFPSANSYDFIPTMYVEEVRISDTARYTSGFTPSTTAFENDANTLLLLHAEEGASGTTEIFDDNGATLPTYTPPTPGSLLVSETDRLEVTNANFAFGVSDTWTIECWIYRTLAGSRDFIWDFEGFGPAFGLRFNGTGSPSALQLVEDNNARLTSSGTVGLNTWTHLAVTYDGSVAKLYIDGTNDGTTSQQVDTTQTVLAIGGRIDTTGEGFEGNIDLFRVSDNVRYTTTFTPDTDFSDDANTLLLLKFDGETDGSTTFTDSSSSSNSIASTGSPEIDTDVAKT